MAVSAAVYSAEDAEAIDLLRTLVAAQQGGEPAVQAVVGRRLTQAGCTVEVVPYDPAAVPLVGEFAGERARTAGLRETVIGSLPGDPGRRSLLLFAHPDSEPVAGLAAWHAAPFDGSIIDGRLYGWGVADDLAGVAAAVLAVERAAANGAANGAVLGHVMVASTPSKRHARGVAAVLHQGWTADAALYLHPAESGAGLNEIKAFASGHLEFRITVRGRLPDTTEPGHTAFAHLAVNPIDKAVLLLEALRALDRRRAERVHHPALDAAVGRSTNVMVSTLRGGDDQRLGRLSEICVLGGAVSFPPHEPLDAVTGEIEAAVGEAAAADPWLADHPPQIEWVAGVAGAECPPDHPLFQVAARAVARRTGVEPHVNPMHTSSDIRNPAVQKGMPTIGLGGLCGDLSQNGRHDEWIDVADYLRTIDATTAIILDWCGSPRAGPG